jgi:hypothetical protein
MMHWGIYSQWGCIESWPLVEADTWARPVWFEGMDRTEQRPGTVQADYIALANRSTQPTLIPKGGRGQPRRPA